MNKQIQKISSRDSGIRPIGRSKLEIAYTFQDSGIRPVEKSPDFLLVMARQK